MRGGLVWISPWMCWVENGGRGPVTRAALGMKLVLLLCLDLGKAASVAFERQGVGLKFQGMILGSS